jgi:hypothetical protein
MVEESNNCDRGEQYRKSVKKLSEWHVIAIATAIIILSVRKRTVQKLLQPPFQFRYWTS